MKKNPSRGFTLIELLVVIAIMGVLASVALASLRVAQAKARDSQRLSDLHQIQNALELYRTDRGAYPVTPMSAPPIPDFIAITGCGLGTYTTSGSTGYIPNLAPTYIPKLPVDPTPVSIGRCYAYASNGVDYMIIAYQTVETKVSSDVANGTCSPVRSASDTNPANRPAQPTEADFAMYTTGACSW